MDGMAPVNEEQEIKILFNGFYLNLKYINIPSVFRIRFWCLTTSIMAFIIVKPMRNLCRIMNKT